jgi:hypothetical protein
MLYASEGLAGVVWTGEEEGWNATCLGGKRISKVAIGEHREGRECKVGFTELGCGLQLLLELRTWRGRVGWRGLGWNQQLSLNPIM